MKVRLSGFSLDTQSSRVSHATSQVFYPSFAESGAKFSLGQDGDVEQAVLLANALEVTSTCFAQWLLCSHTLQYLTDHR